MVQIVLPSQVYENHIFHFIRRLGSANNAERVVVDFSDVSFLIPAAVVSLLAAVHRWRRDGKEVDFINFESCEAYQYLQRMNFFHECGLDLPELFQRRDAGGRFVPIHRFGRGVAGDSAELATDVAKCIAPELADSDDPNESGFYDCIQYSVSELANNVRQHAQSYGFISAQYTPSTDLARVAIADCGIGILQSFIESASPHYYNGMNDVASIRLALEPQISSKTHIGSAWGGEPINAGVGLTLLRSIAEQAGGGVVLVSGCGYVSSAYESVLEEDNRYAGTLCALYFRRRSVKNFYDVLQRAKENVGLIETANDYSELFQ